MANIREITSGLKYPDGPVAMDDGSVVVTELQGAGWYVCSRMDQKKSSQKRAAERTGPQLDQTA